MNIPRLLVALGSLIISAAPAIAEGPTEAIQTRETSIHLYQVACVGSEVPPDTMTDTEFRKEKIIASILAFPVPFGFTGLHRIYLGSEPWVPVVYLCTGGGGVGIIPLIDFICILSADKETFETYINNPKFFMWIE